MILEIDDTGCFIMESCLCQTQISFYSFPFATSQRRLMLTKWCKRVKHLGNYWRAGFSGDSHLPQAWPCWPVNTMGHLSCQISSWSGGRYQNRAKLRRNSRCSKVPDTKLKVNGQIPATECKPYQVSCWEWLKFFLQNNNLSPRTVHV